MPTKIKRKEAALTVEPMNLPTKSWRALLSDQSLNAEAVPFVPSQTAPAAETKERVTKMPIAVDEPEWMQYLSKKLNASGASPLKPHTIQSQRFPAARVDAAGSFSRKHGGRNEISEDGPSGGNVLIHTEAYLQLLKEGSTKKAPNNAGKRPGNKVSAPSGKAGLTAFSSLRNDEPMTTSNLLKKWVGSASPEAADNTAEEVVAERTVQDDIAITKMVCDKDLSDPAYYSEAESIETKNAGSSHRMGRRPKMVASAIRTYVMQDLSYCLDAAVGMLLLRLQRFTDQQRTIFGSSTDEKLVQLNQHRRFVIGLKEVARRTKQNKVECLIVAPDIEEDNNKGGLDDRMRELLALAYQNNTPVIFALSRARLGKALGKSLHISVLGVLDARGAQDLLRESVGLAGDCQKSWLQQLQK